MFFQLSSNFLNNSTCVLFPLFSLRIYQFPNFLIFFWLQISETNILKFPFYHSNSMSNRCINFYRFLRFLNLLFRFHILQSPHIMQSIRQFYNYNPNIISHCNDHFSNVLDSLTISSWQIS